jgi:hypothetical protein
MLTLQKVEKNLRLPILNICLASVAGKENDLREAKRMLVETVHDMLVTVAHESAAVAPTEREKNP